MATLDRTKDNPWVLKIPPGTAEYTMHVDEKEGKSVLVCTVGTTTRTYDARCVDDLYAMLKAAGDWVELCQQRNKMSEKSRTKCPRFM
jgi:hypothetical protein